MSEESNKAGRPGDPNGAVRPPTAQEGSNGTDQPNDNAKAPNHGEDRYIGLELEGQIELRSLLGVGTMGRVYRAYQLGTERDVAVKIMRRELSKNSDLVARFHREAKIASRLVHPNVVQVFMSGTVAESQGSPLAPEIVGALYVVMEYLGGVSLLTALSGSRADCATENSESAGTTPMPLARALRIILQVCDAVGEAHRQNIVHRDLKPENVMLLDRANEPDSVKVLDFGIARVMMDDRSIWTQAGLIFGTAPYVSPEGAQGEPVGPAADVYAIATMLYECLAGHTPFHSVSPVKLLFKHVQAPAPDIRSLAPTASLPEPLAEVIMANLVKEPTDRARCARHLGADLITAAHDSGLSLEQVRVPFSLRETALGGSGAGPVNDAVSAAGTSTEPSPLNGSANGTAGELPAAQALDHPPEDGATGPGGLGAGRAREEADPLAPDANNVVSSALPLTRPRLSRGFWAGIFAALLVVATVAFVAGYLWGKSSQHHVQELDHGGGKASPGSVPTSATGLPPNTQRP